jgi:hypothetical protein
MQYILQNHPARVDNVDNDDLEEVMAEVEAEGPTISYQGTQVSDMNSF